MKYGHYTSTIPIQYCNDYHTCCSMYDVDGNGWIDLGEMTKIVKSIYKMMGPNQVLVEQLEMPEKRAEDIFRRMDINADGRVTRQEFVRCCLNDSKLLELLAPSSRCDIKYTFFLYSLSQMQKHTCYYDIDTQMY